MDRPRDGPICPSVPVSLADCLTSHDSCSHAARQGSIVGAGIYVVIGFTAKDIAGPAIVLSYGIAGLAALSSGLSFAQLGKHVHTSGGAFEYSTAVFGELVGWLVGWSTVLEITLSSSAVSRGMRGYLLGTTGSSPSLDPVALLLIALLSVILCVGIRESARFNMAVCSINMSCILFVVLSSLRSASVSNLTQGDGFAPYGMSGVFSAAGIVFFSFIGFDYIPNAAEEAINPTRDVPRSIVTSLLIASALYMGMAFSMVLMQPYLDIDLSAPYKAAFIAQGKQLAALVVSAGAVCGITTSTMTGLLSNARLLAVLSRQRYLPFILSRIHESTATPVIATVFTGAVAGLLALLVDISVLTELVSAATLAIFTVVNIAALVCVLQSVHGDPPSSALLSLSSSSVPLTSGTPPITGPIPTSWPVGMICASPIVASALSRLTESAAASTMFTTVFVWLPACLMVSRIAHAPIWAPAFGVLSTGFLFCSLHAGSLVQYAVYIAVGYGVYMASSKRRREEAALVEYVEGL